MTPSAMTGTPIHNFNLETSEFTHLLQKPPPFALVRGSFLHELAKEGDVLSAELILAAGSDINDQDELGWRPLHAAAFYGHLDMVMFLVGEGAMINAPVLPLGHTALTLAVQQSRYDIVSFLMGKGADLSVIDTLTGSGLLHIAAEKGDIRMTGILIAGGASVFHEDAKGMTARDVAARRRHKALESALLKVMEHQALPDRY